ncbi:hypothetical protein Kisp01_40920 [Kineosporia sp. NBRC 101677]|nr:hypothetical protein Kisp01_40920 [Kineosporia sp. NBRC 101677]
MSSKPLFKGSHMDVEALERRVQQLEDREAIIAAVVEYARAIDRADWQAYGDLHTDPVHIDFSEAGLPPADFPREQFVGFAAQNLETWDARQHLSTNHQVRFDGDDRAVCASYLYAQHYRKGEPVYLMRGWYDHHLVRVEGAWWISGVVQHISWLEGAPETR